MNWYLIGFIYLLLAFKLFSDTFLYDKIKNRIKRRKNRQKALEKAKTFLKPYKDPFESLCLSNQHCTVSYTAGKTLFALGKKPDKDGNKVSLLAQLADFEILSVDEIWDIMCENFSYDTTFDDIFSICNKYGLKIKSNYIGHKAKLEELEEIKKQNRDRIANKIYSELITQNNDIIDVNSCSEAELIALPGVNVVLSKKIIKYRDEKGAFNSVEDFIAKMSIKPHFAEQIKNLIEAKPIEKTSKKKTKQERILDV